MFLYIFPQSCEIALKIINVNIIIYSLTRIILGVPNCILLEIRIVKTLVSCYSYGKYRVFRIAIYYF